MRFLSLTAALLATAAALAPALPLAAQEAAEPKGENAAAVLPAITVSTVGARKLRDIVIASGLVGPVEEVQVIPSVNGQQVEALLADVGDKVTAGQVLARLSSSSLSLQKTELEAALTAAKAAADSALAADLEAQLKDVTDSLDRKASTLTRSEVKAPVAGEVTARNAELGGMASSAAGPMFTIVRDGLLELRADVSEADLTRLATGQTAALTFVGAAAPLGGTVRLVEPSINAATRLGRIRIALTDSAAVRSGMFVEAEVLVAEREALAVPVTAVGSYEGAPIVMLITNGEAARQPVKTGIREGGWIEITEGLTGGETIVTKAGSFVRQGDKINPVPETPANEG